MIPNNFFGNICHIGCAVSLHSMTNSGLMAGGQNSDRDRQTERIEVLSNKIERSHFLRYTPSLLYLESNFDGISRNHIRESICVIPTNADDFLQRGFLLQKNSKDIHRIELKTQYTTTKNRETCYQMKGRNFGTYEV